MPVPKHIGIIMDGNRRFAKRLMLKPWKGHEWGAKKVKALFEWAKPLGVEELTLYSFSIENFNRPKEEFDYLMSVVVKETNALLTDPLVTVHKIRVNFIGRLYMFPKEVQDSINALMEATKNNDGFIYNFAFGYGGRTEVIDATKKIAQQVKEGTLDINQINEESFSKCLYTDHEPEMIIRTGGDHRTSNFLPFQAAYSEWFFIEKLWPEFEKEDFVECIEQFQSRERRFGK